MQQAIQFETSIESGMIRIPEQYIWEVPNIVKVTLTPVNDIHIKYGSKAKAGELSIEDFTACGVLTREWPCDAVHARS